MLPQPFEALEKRMWNGCDHSFVRFLLLEIELLVSTLFGCSVATCIFFITSRVFKDVRNWEARPRAKEAGMNI